jgi:flagellar M-ring protein FliF
MRGNLLNRPRTRGTGDEPEPSEAALEYRRSIEKDLLSKIHRTLEPLLGPEAFRAGVSVECDFTSGEQSEEVFDPGRSVMTASQRTEDLAGSPSPGGIPGTASNLPRPESRPQPGAGGHARRTENITYQTSRTVRRLRLPQGQVKRISVSLLVDHSVRWEGQGAAAKRVVEAPSPERINAIRELVTGAAGIQPDRGDQLIVESLPFESTLNWRPEEGGPAAGPGSRLPLPEWLGKYLENRNLIVLAAAGGGGLLLLLALGVLFVLRRRRTKRLSGKVAGPSLGPGEEAVAALAAGDAVGAKIQERLAEQAALKARQEDEALRALKLPSVKTKKAEVLTKHIAEEAQKDPVAMAQLVRTWLNEEED